MELQNSIRLIKGIGEKSEKLFARLGIHTVEELLQYYPKDYEVFEDIVDIAQVREGQTAAIQVNLLNKPKLSNTRKLKIVSCMVKDASGVIQVTWFNMGFLLNQLQLGKKYIMRGNVIRKNGVLVINQPKILTEYEFYNQIGKWQPIYGLTAGLTNQSIKKAIGYALKETDLTGDYLPLEIRRKNDLADRRMAMKQIHFPDNKNTLQKARTRMVFDEFFLFMLGLHQLQRQKHHKTSGFILRETKALNALLETLPYHLTNAQQTAWSECKQDLRNGKVMNRLIQGDVGSGKTILAVLALLMAAENGYQGALMVPTEVLAKQHAETFEALLEPFGVRIALLIGSMTAKEKKLAYDNIKNHDTDIIIGTHALIQEKVEYHGLALVVTDEQHRFGVRQREILAGKGREPHILVMSATPIPRTLAIILYGDLDISIIDELPKGRLPIKNCVVGTSYRPKAYDFIEKQVEEGHQAFVICPMVEDSEAIEAENVIEYTQQLRERLPVFICVEYLHGKMKAAEKNAVMESFADGEIQVLVSTTVVEVGIDVPNATVMMIENAERFGLAQLHQLRGRIGRGLAQSYCIFMSGNERKEIMERLNIVGHSNNGFEIAEKDLKIRGPGDLFGVRQSGDYNFRIGDIIGDAVILKAANEAAKEFTKDDIKLLCKKYRGLREKISSIMREVFL